MSNKKKWFIFCLTALQIQISHASGYPIFSKKKFLHKYDFTYFIYKIFLEFYWFSVLFCDKKKNDKKD